MARYLCIFLIVVSCSTGRVIKYEPELWGPFAAEASWFELSTSNDPSKKQVLIDHKFLDFNQDIYWEENSIVFMVTTPATSDRRMKLNLLTGRLEVRGEYCSRVDMSKKYGRAIDGPPMTMGVIPRVLDKHSFPQRVIVFGREDYYQKQANGSRVRVVGGLIEKNCQKYPCVDFYRYHPRQILVAVDPLDPKYDQTKTLTKLKSQVDWDKVIAFLENEKGGDQLGGEIYPTLKIEGELAPEIALKKMKTEGVYWNWEKIKAFHKLCSKIDNYFWKKMVAPSKKRVTPSLVARRYINFMNKFGERYQLCQQFTPNYKHEHQAERNLFKNMTNAFTYLQKLGYFFHCSKQAWFPNPIKGVGDYAYNAYDELRRCTAIELRQAFATMPQAYANLKKNNRPFYEWQEKISPVNERPFDEWVLVEPDIMCENNQKSSNIKMKFPRRDDWKNGFDYILPLIPRS